MLGYIQRLCNEYHTHMHRDTCTRVHARAHAGTHTHSLSPSLTHAHNVYNNLTKFELDQIQTSQEDTTFISPFPHITVTLQKMGQDHKNWYDVAKIIEGNVLRLLF